MTSRNRKWAQVGRTSSFLGDVLLHFVTLPPPPQVLQALQKDPERGGSPVLKR